MDISTAWQVWYPHMDIIVDISIHIRIYSKPEFAQIVKFCSILEGLRLCAVWIHSKVAIDIASNTCCGCARIVVHSIFLYPIQFNPLYHEVLAYCCCCCCCCWWWWWWWWWLIVIKHEWCVTKSTLDSPIGLLQYYSKLPVREFYQHPVHFCRPTYISWFIIIQIVFSCTVYATRLHGACKQNRYGPWWRSACDAEYRVGLRVSWIIESSLAPPITTVHPYH